jgi:hypothetical protein
MRRAAAALLGLCGCLESPPAAIPLGDDAGVDGGAPITCNATATRSDSFGDTMPGAWQVVSTHPMCVVSELDGILSLANTAVDQECGYRTTDAWPLTQRIAAVDVVQSGDGAPNLQFRAKLETGDRVFIERNLTGLRAGFISPGGTIDVVVSGGTWQDYLHRHWRFRGDSIGDEVYVEFAGDDLEWHPLTTFPLPAIHSADCVFFELFTSGVGGLDLDDRVSFDDFRL